MKSGGGEDGRGSLNLNKIPLSGMHGNSVINIKKNKKRFLLAQSLHRVKHGGTTAWQQNMLWSSFRDGIRYRTGHSGTLTFFTIMINIVYIITIVILIM